MATPKRDQADWPALDDALRTLWATELSTAQIGINLGVSKNAAVGRAGRLGLPARPSPIVRNGEPKPDKRTRTARTATLSSIINPVAIVPEIEVVLPTVRPGRVQPCCYPLGEPGKPSFHFCDAASVPGKPYCLAHCKLVYVSYGAKPANEGDAG